MHHDHGHDGDARRSRFRPDPVLAPADAVALDVVTTIPADTKVIGVPTFADGPVPERVPIDRATLESSGSAAC